MTSIEAEKPKAPKSKPRPQIDPAEVKAVIGAADLPPELRLCVVALMFAGQPMDIAQLRVAAGLTDGEAIRSVEMGKGVGLIKYDGRAYALRGK